MRRNRRFPAALVVAAVLFTNLLASPVAASRAPAAEAEPAASAALMNGQLQLQGIAGGYTSPLGVVNAGDNSNRLFVLEKGGTVQVVTGHVPQPGFFLDIRSVSGGLSTGGERGLLGLAFHPSFESNRKLFAYYTNGGGDLVIAEFTANAAGTSVNANTVDPLLVIEHSAQSNHNGGQLLFGPDGYLYVFTGDGGGSGDPSDNSQDGGSLLGKVLRIAPNLSGAYTIPADNPFIAGATLDAIWALGMRNPWRASFDRGTGRLWIADVGQGSWEEINREAAGSGGHNYGWDCREGLHAYNDPSPGISCSGLTFTNPVAEYGHGSGDCSVTGGFVYRGSVFPDFVSQYVLGDFCSGRLWTMQSGEGSPSLQFHRDTNATITSFGEGENGEIYLTDYAGTLYRLVAPPFFDVANSPFIDDITWLFYRGVTTGCAAGLFCPSKVVTRDQMASFIARALNLPAAVGDYFVDDNGSIHEADINRIAEAGITSGCAAYLYCPTQPVSRAQMASFLARALNLPATGTDFFTDDESSLHEDNINRTAAAGITNGCGGGRYCPASSTTREQMAAFLHRALD